MKAIKIILGSITFLVIGFLATGIFVSETRYKIAVIIDKPLIEVFETFNDTTQIKNWIPELKSLKVLSSSPEIKGNLYEMTVDNKGQQITMTQKIIDYVEHKKVVTFTDAENMLKTDFYLFKSDNGKTHLMLETSCQSDSYLVSCVFPYFKSTFKAIDQSYLNNFKLFVEQL